MKLTAGELRALSGAGRQRKGGCVPAAGKQAQIVPVPNNLPGK